jgi:hypothetical protein
MERLRNSIMAIDNHVGSSTFGRVFRLEGSGHVSASCQQTWACMLIFTTGYGDQTYKVHDRNPSRTDYILHDVLHHCCQRESLLKR